MREKIDPATEAMAPAERSCLVRFKLSRMTGISGAAAKLQGAEALLEYGH